MADHGFEEVLTPNLYFDRQHNSEAAKILPGEYYATARDMLPDAGQDQNNPLGRSARYGTYAMEILINQLLKMGAKRSNFEVKVFGGGAVLRGFTVAN
ncbi:MAG: chemoreceptor glutamine deamidase CheD, partial [Gallionella sp.]|nr:chemoreceptor glutamine deamidase CheD [Gallionella sp.]